MRRKSVEKSKKMGGDDGLCVFCGKHFSARTYLETHMNTHTEERPYQCSHCDDNFRASAALHVHTSNLHLGRKHTCNVCQQTFGCASNLFVHKKTHKNQQNNFRFHDNQESDISPASAKKESDESLIDVPMSPPSTPQPDDLHDSYEVIYLPKCRVVLTRLTVTTKTCPAKQKEEKQVVEEEDSSGETGGYGWLEASEIKKEPTEEIPVDDMDIKEGHLGFFQQPVDDEELKAGYDGGDSMQVSSSFDVTLSPLTPNLDGEKIQQVASSCSPADSTIVQKQVCLLKEQEFPCLFCGQWFSKQRKLATHVSTVHRIRAMFYKSRMMMKKKTDDDDDYNQFSRKAILPPETKIIPNLN